jgi:hypothetical protein
MIRHTYYATLSATFNDKIRDATHQALVELCEEIHQDHRDKQVRRITKKQAWGRYQEIKIQELQDQNATQEVIMKEL